MDLTLLAEILEILMLVCFGLSWPISVYKSFKFRTSVGKSAFFNIFLIVGYVAGIASKFIKMDAFMETATPLSKGIFIFALVMYFVNLAMITTNLVMFYVNRNLDRKKALEAQNN